MTRKRWVGVLLAVGLLAGAGWLLVSAGQPRPPFAFLPDMPPTKVLSIDGSRLEVYQFRGDAKTIVTEAEAAIAARGYVLKRTRFGFTTDLSFGQTSLMITAGKTVYANAGDGLMATEDAAAAPNYVTVAILNIGPPESYWERLKRLVGF